MQRLRTKSDRWATVPEATSRLTAAGYLVQHDGHNCLVAYASGTGRPYVLRINSGRSIGCHRYATRDLPRVSRVRVLALCALAEGMVASAFASQEQAP